MTASINISHEVSAFNESVDLTDVGSKDWFVVYSEFPNPPRLSSNARQKLVHPEELIQGFDWLGSAGSGSNSGSSEGPNFDCDSGDCAAGALGGWSYDPGSFGSSLDYGFTQRCLADTGTRTVRFWVLSYWGNIHVSAEFTDGSATQTHDIAGITGPQVQRIDIEFTGDAPTFLRVTVTINSKVSGGDGGFTSFRYYGAALSLDSPGDGGGGDGTMPTAGQRLFREDGCQLLKNESDEDKRRFVFHLFDTSGEPVNDVTPSSGQIRVSKSGDSIANGGGDWAADGGPGIYVYTATQAETDTDHFVSISVNVPGVVPVSTFKRIGGPTIAVGAVHRRHPVFLVVAGAAYEGGDINQIAAMYDGAASESRDWDWDEVGDGHYWFEMDSDAVTQERVITFVFGVDAVEGTFSAHWVANLQVGGGGGGGAVGELNVQVISPTPGVEAGDPGGFPKNSHAADNTPVIVQISGETSSLSRRSYLIVQVQGGWEAVYWGENFVEPYISGSTQRSFTDADLTILELSIRRDAGWPRLMNQLSDPKLRFKASAFEIGG